MSQHESSQLFAKSTIRKIEKPNKLYIMKTINNMIKNSDISQINKVQSLNQMDVPNLEDQDFFDEEKDVHNNLKDLRKKYDFIKEEQLKKERTMFKLRKEIDQLKIKEDQLKEHQRDIDRKFEELQNRYEMTKIKQEEALTQKKTYLHILDRMKHDKISYSIKVNKAEELLEKEKQEYMQQVQISQSQKQLHMQSQYVLENLLNNVEQEHKQREIQLNNFKKTIQIRQEAEQKREERLQKQQIIAEEAAADILDSNEKKWRKLLLVHKFLNVFLKKKMEREMKNFEKIEQSFQRIKAQTGITDTEEIVKKFLNREQTYGQLLVSIAEYEKKIEKLKKENELSKDELQKLKSELNEFENNKNVKKSDVNLDIYKDLEIVQDRYQRGKVIKERLYTWTIRQLIRIDKVNGQYGMNNYYDKFPRDNVLDAFQQLQERINQELAQINQMKEEEAENVKANITKQSLLDETQQEIFQKKNIRVKPLEGSKKEASDIYDSLARFESLSKSNISGLDTSEFHDEDEKDEKQEDEKKHMENLRLYIKKDLEYQKDKQKQQVLKKRASVLSSLQK